MKFIDRVVRGARDGIPINTNCHIVLRGADGQIKGVRDIHNSVNPNGDKHVADRLSDAADDIMSHMAIGTGADAGAAATTLTTENGRVALDSKTQGTGAADNDVVYIGTFPAGTGTGTITEAGIFNHATTDTGDLLCYSHFTGIAKAAGDALEITWTLTCGST
jgi:hypothetical protein